VLVVADLEQQLQFFGEQRIVVLEPVPEERERIDKGSPPDDHFGASVRQQIESGKVLEHPHRVCGAENGDGAGESDSLRASGRGGKDDGGSGIKKVLAVMLANAEHVESSLIGVLDLGDEIVQALRRT